MSTVLEAESLYRFFHADDDETLALQGVSIRVDAGEIVAVTGPSGSGKSTLLACLAGLDDPDGGVVWIEGERLSRRPEHERARIRARSIGILYQSTNLVGHLSVADNVRLAQDIAGRGHRPDDDLARVGIGHRAHSRPSELSGGELARAGLAVALANAPSLILADEPTGELDSANGVRVLEVLRERAREGAAVVLVTHRTDAAGFVDREIALIDGRVR